MLTRLRFRAFILFSSEYACVYRINIFAHNSTDTNTSVFFGMQKNIIYNIIIVGTVHSEGLLHVYVCYRMCSQFSLAGYTIEIIKRINLSQLPYLWRRCICFVRVAIFHTLQKIGTTQNKTLTWLLNTRGQMYSS